MASADVLESRLSREAEHFDQVYRREEQVGNLQLTDDDKQRYGHPSPSTAYARQYYYHLMGPLAGRSILEIACGNGVDTCLAAYNGADVSAYDISEAAVSLTRKRAEVNGVSDRVHLEVCGDLSKAFAGRQFDAVVGYAALHHLPLKGLGEAIRARLKPGGMAVFSEPVVNSHALAYLRSLIPYRPAEITDDEEALNDQVIAELARPFTRIVRREFECISRAYRLFPSQTSLVRAVHELDAQLMHLPPLRRFASAVVFALYRD